MAYVQTAYLIQRIREVLEDAYGSLRTITAGTYEGDFPQGLDEAEAQRRSLIAPRTRVNVNVIGRSPYSPPINGSLIIYDLNVTVIASRLLQREAQITPDDYDDVQAASAADADVIRQALEWPGNLTTTSDGHATDLVSGMLSYESSTFPIIGQINDGAQRIEAQHVFSGFLISRPATS